MFLSLIYLHAKLVDLHWDLFLGRNRNLKRLALPIWSRLTVSGMRKAFKYWKGLESLTVPDFSSPMKLMKAIGTNCKNFSELKLTCNLNVDYANAIVKYLPKLKVLSLRATIVFNKETLICILDGLNHLEVLNMSLRVRISRLYILHYTMPRTWQNNHWKRIKT